METVAVLLEYDGTGFSGSQGQPGRRTVCGELEAALLRLEAAPRRIMAAGRTDAGVHAEGQVVSFQSHRLWHAADWQRRLDRLLPDDIGVLQAWKPASGFDARKSACWRRYRYDAIVAPARSVFRRRWTGWWRSGDAGRAAAVIDLLQGRHDFGGFALGAPGDSERELEEASLAVDGERWTFHFRARSFLTRQVRFMVGAAMAAADGTIDVHDVGRVLATGRRPATVAAAPASGLFLAEVRYPEGALPSKDERER